MSSKTVVVKVGSQSFIDLKSNLEAKHQFASQINTMIKNGHRVIIVSSGAVALGLEIMQEKPSPVATPRHQARYAAVGQPELHRWWQSLIEYPTAQLLLDRTLLETREAFVNTVDVLESFHRHHTIPICNENDAMAHQRSKLGNNDLLAAIIAQATSADWLFFVTNTPGVYRDYPNSTDIIENLSQESEQFEEQLDGTKSALGTGGMGSKIKAARLASDVGAHVVIGDIALDFNAWLSSDMFSPPQQMGTWLFANDNSALKRFTWMQHVGKAFGTVTIDEGAKNALLTTAASLLSVGVVKVEGVFESNQVINIVDQQNNVIAKGMSRVTATELLNNISDLKTAKNLSVESSKSHNEVQSILVVHRNDMMLFSPQSSKNHQIAKS